MAIPWDWLCCPTTPAEVEADLAELGAPNLWLKKRRTLLDRMVPGDELWEYAATQYGTAVEKSPERIAGFEQVLNGEALDRLGLSEPVDRTLGFRDGFAVVRGDQIIDWIESPW
jgi:hypothetical protein